MIDRPAHLNRDWQPVHVSPRQVDLLARLAVEGIILVDVGPHYGSREYSEMMRLADRGFVKRTERPGVAEFVLTTTGRNWISAKERHHG